jgi:hypothetical protein
MLHSMPASCSALSALLLAAECTLLVGRLSQENLMQFCTDLYGLLFVAFVWI